MPAAVFTPGPIHHFALFVGESTPYYLGTAILAPENEAEKFKIPVMNDLSGRSVPFQLVQDGEIWYVMTSMNRFNQAVIDRIMALESGGAALGQESGLARGTLTIGVSDWSLILLNGYATTPAASNTNPELLPVGRQWFSCNVRKYKESTVGTRTKEVAMSIECQNMFIPSTRGFKSYTQSSALINYSQLLALATANA